MRGVRIDPKARRARVRAGAIWQDVTAPASAYGLAPLAGSAHDVGVVGYTLGGGLSWLAREHGFACDSVTAIELVTADGALIRTDAHNDPELFAALKGGGGNFGVVTAMEFKLYPVEQLTGGAMLWPAGARRGDLQRLERVDADAPEPRHLAVPAAQRPAAAGRPGAAARPQLRRGRGRDPRRRRAPRPAARARCPRSTWSARSRPRR